MAAKHGVSAIGIVAAHGISGTRMRAGRYLCVGAIPAGVHALVTIYDALHTAVVACSHHHLIANIQRAIVIVVMSWADGSVLHITLISGLRYDNTASDSHIATLAIVATADAGCALATRSRYLLS